MYEQIATLFLEIEKALTELAEEYNKKTSELAEEICRILEEDKKKGGE